jgi:hypothetical protein
LKRPKGDYPWALHLRYSRSPRGDLSVTGVEGSRRKLLTRALAEYVTHGRPGTWSLPLDDTVGLPTDLAFHFADDSGRLRLQVGVCFFLAAGAFPPSELSADWRVALGRGYVARQLYVQMADKLGSAPPPAGPSPVSLGDGVSLKVLEVSLTDNGLTLSGILSKSAFSEADPFAEITAEFSLPVTLSLTQSHAINVEFGTATVSLNEWHAKIVDFLSGSALSRAVRDGIRAALADQTRGQLAGFFSAQLLQDLLTFGTTANLRLKPDLQTFRVDRHALVVTGRLPMPSVPKPVAVLRALVHGDGTATLDASGSWAPGGEIDAVEWRFGDGTSIDLSGDDLKFIVHYHYPGPGSYRASVKVSGSDGQNATAFEQVTIPNP